ncbi:C-type lectin domain family 12 member A-like [Mixophyes fleayi]|uniref:C-type lectin domain family 12 member A-like n=1 Tax=Mixophyes fleayi TaxID=3061075 RepID=UPI003F4D95FE
MWKGCVILTAKSTVAQFLATMIEEVTYADLRFHDSSQQTTSLKLEERIAVGSTKHNVKRHGCQKVAITVTGILVFLLLGALLTMAILLLQAHGKQADLYARIENVSRALSHMKNNLCIRNTGMQKEPCLLCPFNWLPNNGKCYFMPEDRFSWEESQTFCSTQNSSLMLPKTHEDKVFIDSYYKNVYPLWIGLSCSVKTNEEWTWVDNTTDNSIPKSECTGKKCVSLYSRFDLYHGQCSDQIRFICERLAMDLSITV